MYSPLGYADDIAEIVACLPPIYQSFLMSATLSPELNSLKRVVLHSPAILKLEEEKRKPGEREGQLSQFYLTLPKKDKNLVVYVFLKLGLLKGKGLFFVNTTDGGYRLKLFLEQFHIRSAVLNAELPLHSRLNIIEQFNAGNFDYLIATDESTDAGIGVGKEIEGEESDVSDDDSEDEHKGVGSDGDEKGGKSKRKSPKEKKKTKISTAKGKKKDSEYGVARGLDFHGVSFVVNIDFPPTVKSYTHRIGRTARGGAKGVALSFVETDSATQNDTLAVVQESQAPLPISAPVAPDDALRPSAGGPAEHVGPEADSVGPQVQLQPTPLDFDLREIEGFRYRVEDVGRAVTKIAVKETRAAELRAEILNSERLQSHFSDNPSDLQLLRHDRVATHVSKVQNHLK